MSEAKKPVLEVRNLSVTLPKGADREFAVDKVSFTVNPGEIVCLVGESGSGKSVIAFTVMGLLAKALKPSSGEILLEGENILAASEDAAARAALHAHVDDLPGADDRAEPGHDLRRADRRGAEHPHQPRRRPAQGQDHRHPRAREAARARAHLRLLSAPALGRPAPAHHDRHGAGARSRAADRRRADHRARRHHPGRDPEADRRAAGEPRAPACCSSPTISASSPRSPIASPCCAGASWWRWGRPSRSCRGPSTATPRC